MDNLFDEFANYDADEFDFRAQLPADTVIEQYLDALEG
jgi:hypothetical protein